MQQPLHSPSPCYSQALALTQKGSSSSFGDTPSHVALCTAKHPRCSGATSAATQQRRHIPQEAVAAEAGLLHFCCEPAQLCAGRFSQRALVGAPACRRRGGAGGVGGSAESKHCSTESA